MRIGIALISQETNSFSPRLTDLETLRAHGLWRGEEVVERGREMEGLAGFLDVVGEEHVVGLIRAHAGPAGPMTNETVDTVVGWLAEELGNVGDLDGLLLCLHGALAGESEPDVDGQIIERTREIVGENTVIGVALDMHANLTRRMMAGADVIRGYHTHPHLDQWETSRATAEMVVQTIQGGVRPVMRAVKIPMITPADLQITDQEPMRSLFAAIEVFERSSDGLSGSLFAVQPWLDVPELGWCALGVADGNAETADRFAGELADAAWAQRTQYLTSLPTYREALDRAFEMEARPVVVSDLADATNGGATGDSTWYLAELLRRQPAERCYLTMVDPEAVQDILRAGEGAMVRLCLGGKQDVVYSRPVEVMGRVARIVPIEPDRALPLSMGVGAVLEIGAIYVVVTERPGPGHDPVVYVGAGLDPRKAKILLAKSPVDFRAGYREVARAFLLGEAPGLTLSDLTLLHFERAPRPIFPLDDLSLWSSGGVERYKGHRG